MTLQLSPDVPPESATADGSVSPTQFVDFHLRAWRAGADQVEVLVHNSPAGVMRRPVVAPFPSVEADALRHLVDDLSQGPPGTQSRLIAAGKKLAQA